MNMKGKPFLFLVSASGAMARTRATSGFLRLASCFLLLTSAAHAQDTFVLQAQGKLEARGEGKSPVAVIEGTTSLPDRAILRFSMYYSKIDMKQELNYKRDHVNNGAFRTEIDLQTDTPFPGLYWCRIDFDAGSQYQTTRDALGDRMNSTVWEISFRVGTELEAEQADAGVREELIASFNTLDRVQKEIHTEYTLLMKRFDTLKAANGSPVPFDQKAWIDKAMKWKSQIDAAFHTKSPPMVSKVLGLEDVRTTFLEELSDMLNSILQLSTSGLASPKKDQQQWAQLNRAQYSFKKGYEMAMKRLGVAIVSNDEIKKRLQQVVAVKEDLVRAAARRNSPEEWKTLRENWPTQFFNAALALTEVAPDMTYKKAMEIIEAGQAMNETLQSLEPGPTVTPALQLQIDLLSTLLENFSGLLDGTYRYPVPEESELPAHQHDHQDHADHEKEHTPHDSIPK